MNSLITLLASSGLAGADLLVLVLATQRLGRRPGGLQTWLLALAVMLKVAVLVLGAVWISRQPWYHRGALFAGLLAPFALFVLWQGLRLQLKRQR
jgi:hypothetical protein